MKHIASACYILLILSSIGSLFIISNLYPADYYESIDIVDTDYSPFSKKHLPSLLVFFVLGIISTRLIHKKGRNLPPLALLLCVTFMIVWSILCIPIIIQLSHRSDGQAYINPTSGIIFITAPIMQLITTLVVLGQLIADETKIAQTRSYKNRFLNALNERLKSTKSYGFLASCIVFPLLILIVLILIVLGQEYDSLVKVFTETTTWKLSQKAHPPYLDHIGHYLCTVAACGSPGIVKPIRLGTRHGNTIIVNRQLQIANAFEELIQVKWKRSHTVIRSVYDNYGYPLSKKITTPFGSNLTYFLMKPIECFFLLTLYLFCAEPEKLIKRQYTKNV
jgi:hypothetical protein